MKKISLVFIFGLSLNLIFGQCLQITCPANIVQSTTGQCSAIINYVAPIGVNPCVSGNTVFVYTGAMQSFTVPAGVTSITIEALGAQGGGGGGLGAKMTGTFTVTPGQVLQVLVGGLGGNGGSYGSGGGGGTFVVAPGNVLLIAAGGGGGTGHNNNGVGQPYSIGTTATSGNAGGDTNGGAGGTAGNGGALGNCNSCGANGNAGGGGGFLTNGAGQAPAYGGLSFLNGGSGGILNGGFGGGGGSTNNSIYDCGVGGMGGGGVVIPINVPTRSVNSSYRQVGILTRVNGQETILSLMGRPLFPSQDKWQFYTMSDKNQSVKLPVTNKKRSCTSDMGCDNIYNGDTIYVEGYNDAFRATIYDNAIQYSIPYV